MRKLVPARPGVSMVDPFSVYTFLFRVDVPSKITTIISETLPLTGPIV